ncbi:MAG: heavy metal-binding domain-containing protein, partial [Acidimicrobiales bacterium]
MTDWDGEGLPPAARARVLRAGEGAPGASLLKISGQAALEGCGFSVVGEAMGCIVQHLGWRGFGGCGYYGYGGSPGGFLVSGLGQSPLGSVTSAGQSGYVGYAPYAEALYEGYDTAILRMLYECRDIGGDGVVGVRLQVNRLGNDNSEFIAYGTAVRAHSSSRPANLFSTTLQGHDVAKLLHGGWVPASITVGLSVAVRHDDWATLRQASAWAGNTEVSGYSQLVHHVRSEARDQFRHRS